MFFDPSKQVSSFVFVRRHGHQVSDFITYNRTHAWNVISGDVTCYFGEVSASEPLFN